MSKILEPRFPTVLDATSMSVVKACKQKAYYEVILRQVPPSTNIHFIAGGAYAKGHETFRLLYYARFIKFDVALALACLVTIREYGDADPGDDARPSERAKTVWNVVAALVWYYEDFPPETDYLVPAFLPNERGEYLPAAEFSFAYPLPESWELKNPQTGDPILYGGRLDTFMHHGPPNLWQQALDACGQDTEALAHYLSENYPFYIYDDKTTYQMGSQWASQWKFRSQFLGYMWSLRRAGYPVKGTIVHGSALQVSGPKFLRVPVSYLPHQLEDWANTLRVSIIELIECWQAQHFPKNWDYSCTAYSGCPYGDVCLSPDPERWLAPFTERNWSPVDTETL